MKNNSAGELGGGFYQGKNAPFDFGGEIYASGNVSFAGNDDIHIRYGNPCEILYSITSPDGSIGIYYEDTDGGQLAEWKDGNISVESTAFFINNGEFDFKFDQGEVNTMGYQGIMYTLDLVKKSAPVGSIFGEGSLTNILVIISLIASGVSIFLTVYYNKKKTAPVAVNNVEAEDEE